MSTNKNEADIFNKFGGAPTHWFLTPKNPPASAYSAPVTPLHRLNGYDSGLLEASAELDLGVKDSLNLEYQIKDRESILAELKNKIMLAQNAGNQQSAMSFTVKKQRIEGELKELNRQFAAQQISPQKSSNNVLSFSSGKKIDGWQKLKRFVRRHILAKVSKKVHSIVTMSDSLDALKNINQNVDELMSLKSPYGETAQNYQKLSEYLYRANKIHSQISKSIKK